jgi:YHYH protein
VTRAGGASRVALLLLSAVALTLGASAAVAKPPDQNALPLGDGKLSTQPQKGSFWSCQTGTTGRATPVQPWIHGTTWDATAKPTVPGSVAWTQQVSIKRDGDNRVITSNGLPDHQTGEYPIPSNSAAYTYDQNPSSIREQQLSVTVPASPKRAAQASCAGGEVGIMTNGVPLFSALDADLVDAVAHHVQDECEGHPQNTGQYHYHGPSKCLKDSGNGHSKLLGYSYDGFGVYGTRGTKGKELSNADLDDCHGHTHTITWSGKKTKLYHYHLTTEFPYAVGCFRGTPVRAGGGQQGGPPPGAPPGGPPPRP